MFRDNHHRHISRTGETLCVSHCESEQIVTSRADMEMEVRGVCSLHVYRTRAYQFLPTKLQLTLQQSGQEGEVREE